MMRFVAVLLFVFCIHTVHSQTLSETIAFEERVYNFGTILEKNGKVSHTFVFKNNGKTPVTINEIYSGCGCIGKLLSKDPVKPGEKGKVVITFNPDYKSGFFSKEIIVYSNNSQNYNHIWVEGTITPMEHPVRDDYPYDFTNGLYLKFKVLAFGYLKQGETRQLELPYANDTNKEMTLDLVLEGSKQGLVFTNPGKIAPKARGVITVSYTMPPGVTDDVVFTLRPYVNNKRLSQNVEVKILNGDKLRNKEQPKQTN